MTALVELRITLLTDGSSDAMLLRPIEWVLRQHTERPFISEWADLRYSREPSRPLVDSIPLAIELYPCDLLFIHRDAEGDSYERRATEIAASIATCGLVVPVVRVVPVRMTEAWFLFDEAAIRFAADNPNGEDTLSLPPLRRVETVLNPKDVLYEALRVASGLSATRRRSFRVARAVHRVADRIDDFAPLRNLTAFAAFESEVRSALSELDAKAHDESEDALAD